MPNDKQKISNIVAVSAEGLIHHKAYFHTTDRFDYCSFLTGVSRILSSKPGWTS